MAFMEKSKEHTLLGFNFGRGVSLEILEGYIPKVAGRDIVNMTLSMFAVLIPA